MANENKVTKIYQLSTLGFNELNKELTAVNTLFEKIKKSKLSAQGKLFAAADATDVKKYADELARLTVEEQRLRTEQARLSAEMKAGQAARQVELQQERQRVAGLKDSSGWYYKILAQVKELGIAIKSVNKPGDDVSFRGQTLQYGQAISKLKELTSAEQEFRRQFQKDGTLVAEYTTGIVQAFKKMGLDDLIGGQITKAGQRINELDNDFAKLKQELSQVGVTGEGSLQKIEKELIDNRKEAIALQTQVSGLQKEFRGAGDIGNQVTASIKNGFSQIRGQFSSFVLQYIGFQALFNKITTEVSQGIADAKQIEGVEAAFKRLNDPSLLSRLREATRGTVSDLKLMAITVQATNFQIPQDKLGELLDFARRRAKETGQSVDFLVDSIVTGIGRKSPLILDNLGISAVRLREKLKGVAEENANVGDVAEAVAQIIREENAKAGTEIETLAEKIQQNEADWKNLRLEFTTNLLPALTTIGTFFLALIGNLPLLTSIIAVLAIGWGVANVQLVLNNAQLVIYNLLLLRNYIALGILSAIQLAYNAVLFVTGGLLRIASAAMIFFGVSATAAAGPLGIVLTVISLIGTALFGLSRAMGNSIETINRHNEKIRIMAEVQREAAAATVEQRTKAAALVTVIKDLTLSEETRNKALRDLIAIDPVFQKALVDGKINYDKLNEALKEYNKNLIENATIKAAQSRVTKETSELERLISLRQGLELKKGGVGSRKFGDLSEEEQNAFVNDRIFSLQGFKGTSSLLNLSISDKEFSKAIGNITRQINNQKKVAEVTAEAFTNLLVKDLKTQDTKDKPTVFSRFAELLKGGTEPQFKKLIEDIEKEKEKFSIFSKEYKTLDALKKKVDELINPKTKTDRQRDSRLTAQQKDDFKDIDAIRDQQLAIEKKKRIENVTDEETYLKNILRINSEAISKKLALLKGSSAEERKQIAELNLEKVTNEQETNKKLFDIRIAERRAQLEEEVRLANQKAQDVLNDPAASENQRARARVSADNKILEAQLSYAADLDRLEKELSQQSLQNEKESADEIIKTKQQLFEDEKVLTEAALKDLQQLGRKNIAEFQSIIATQRLKVSQNGTLTTGQRDRANTELDKQERVGVLAREVENGRQQLLLYKKLLLEKKITDEEYLKFETELKNKTIELNEEIVKSSEDAAARVTDLRSLIQEGLRTLFKVDPGSKEDQLFGRAISESFDLARNAMQEYFASEENNIRKSLELTLERQDREKQMLLDRAQSTAEEESINKQFLARKRKAEIEAGEQLKKQRKAEAKISLAAELANIAIAAAQNPANGVTFGASGAIMYGILAAIALGRYALRVNEINRQQFEFGGMPKRGGEIGGRPHAEGGTPFKYEAEKGELSIVRTKDAPRDKVFHIAGTQKQIASALNQIGGGVQFAAGAKVKRFASGGNLGEALQPPVFIPGIANTYNTAAGGVTAEQFTIMMNKIDEKTDAINSRFDKLEVVQDTNTVTNAQRKIVKQASIGTL